MKKIVLLLLLFMTIHSQAFAGFFNNQPDGSEKLKLSEAVTIYVKDGFVMDEGNNKSATFIYDSKTHTGFTWAPGATEAKKYVDGTFKFFPDNPTRAILDSMAKDPSLWLRYFEAHSCADEKTLRAGLGLPPSQNSLATTCPSLHTEVAAKIGGVGAEAETVAGGLGSLTERQKIATSVLSFPAFQWYRLAGSKNYLKGMETVKKANDPTLLANMERLMKDLPPENEILPLVYRSKVFPSGYKKEWRGAPIDRHEVFDSPEVVAWLGYSAFLDDVLVRQLKNFDYPLSNPSVAPAYVYESGQAILDNPPSAFAATGKVPNAMNAFNLHGLFLGVHEDNQVAGVGGQGRFFAFPFLEAGVEQYRKAWLTWHSLIQRMTPDELRKLALFVDVVKKRPVNSPVADKARDLNTFPMGHFMVSAVAPLDLRAVNLPTEWTVSNTASYVTRIVGRTGEEPDVMNPGLTVRKFLAQVFAGKDAAVNNNPALQSFIKDLFAGDADKCLKTVNATVTDAMLRDAKTAAKTRIAQVQLPTAKLAEAVKANPATLYKHLGELAGLPKTEPKQEQKPAQPEKKKGEIKW